MSQYLSEWAGEVLHGFKFCGRSAAIAVSRVSRTLWGRAKAQQGCELV